MHNHDDKHPDYCTPEPEPQPNRMSHQCQLGKVYSHQKVCCFRHYIWTTTVNTNLLSTWYDIDSIALFVYYQSGRKQKVNLMDCLSNPVTCEILQGSVLGPFLFTLYTSPLSLIRHNIKYHLYPDDTQIYVSLSLKNPDISLEIITKYLLDVSSWMPQGRLKINPDNTELLLIGSKVQVDFFRNVLQQDFLAQEVTPSSARYLCIVLDGALKFKSYIWYISRLL